MSSKKSYPKKLIITSAQASFYINKDGLRLKWGDKGDTARLNKNLYRGLEKFATNNGVDEIRVLPIAGHTIREKRLHSSVEDLDSIYKWSRTFQKQNENVTLSDIRVPPQNVDPSTSRKH
jgi:hypothetical protein